MRCKSSFDPMLLASLALSCVACALPASASMAPLHLSTDDEKAAVVAIVAADPQAGDLIEGTGGARKLRIAGRGKGKSGGYRVITFYAAVDVPVFLLDLYGKGEKANLTQAEKNALRAILGSVADEYRTSVARKVATLGSRKKGKPDDQGR